MKSDASNRAGRPRVWILIGAVLVVVASVLLALALRQPGSARPEHTASPEVAQPTTAIPASATPEPTPTEEAVVASVNGYTITEAYLQRATSLNQVLSELAGQEPLGETDTLQRLIRQQLVLQGAPPKGDVSDQEVQEYIGRMQAAWNVDEETMLSELESAGVALSFLESTIDRLLSVQMSADQLSSDGYDINTWLREQEDAAEIQVFRELSEAPGDGSAEPTPTSSVAVETATPAQIATATTEAEEVQVPAVAPDFELSRADGGTFALSHQLEEGPVVLVFFERCG